MMAGMTWGAVLAVKPLPEAKTRLAGDDADRAGLVIAMLTDVLTATLAAGLTPLVVTPDATITALAAETGAATAGEPAGGGLNPAFRHGQRQLVDRLPGLHGVVFLQADLPAITGEQLTVLLDAHRRSTGEQHRQSFVADSAGTGTAALVRPIDLDEEPRFGTDSAAAHRAAGVIDLVAAAGDPPHVWAGLRRDVDTVSDLDEAAFLGVGPATSKWLRER